MEWKLADAKNKLTEVVNLTLEEGAQTITRRKDRFVLVTEQEYLRLCGEKPNFVEFLMSAPDLEGVDLERSKEPMRDVHL